MFNVVRCDDGLTVLAVSSEIGGDAELYLIREYKYSHRPARGRTAERRRRRR
jgi:hypothetical protein